MSDKGHCQHGEFILRDGCPQCIDEKRLGWEEGKMNKHQRHREAQREAHKDTLNEESLDEQRLERIYEDTYEEYLLNGAMPSNLEKDE